MPNSYIPWVFLETLVMSFWAISHWIGLLFLPMWLTLWEVKELLNSGCWLKNYFFLKNFKEVAFLAFFSVLCGDTSPEFTLEKMINQPLRPSSSGLEKMRRKLIVVVFCLLLLSSDRSWSKTVLKLSIWIWTKGDSWQQKRR